MTLSTKDIITDKETFAITVHDFSLNDLSANHLSMNDLLMNDAYFFNKLDTLQGGDEKSATFTDEKSALPMFDGENTPLFFSQNNSEDEYDGEFGRTDNIEIHSPRSQYEIHNEVIEIHNSSKYKVLSFDEVEKSIEKYYDCDMKYLNEFDLLVTYLNGQKHLFLKGQKLTQTKLNILIVPSLVMSATITLFLPISSHRVFWFTTIFVSLLNATITLLISVVNHYKFESKQELFGHFAKEYENLKNSLEIKNNKLLFIDKKQQQRYISSQIKKMEKRINAIKNSSSVLLPSELNRLFPVIYHINIFSLLKKIENYRTNLIHKFRDVKNEIRFILYNKKKRMNFGSDSESIKKRLDILIHTKERVRKQIVSYKNAYYHIDSVFNDEIKYAESYQNIFLLLGVISPSNCQGLLDNRHLSLKKSNIDFFDLSQSADSKGTTIG